MTTDGHFHSHVLVPKYTIVIYPNHMNFILGPCAVCNTTVGCWRAIWIYLRIWCPHGIGGAFLHKAASQPCCIRERDVNEISEHLVIDLQQFLISNKPWALSTFTIITYKMCFYGKLNFQVTYPLLYKTRYQVVICVSRYFVKYQPTTRNNKKMWYPMAFHFGAE